MRLAPTRTRCPGSLPGYARCRDLALWRGPVGLVDRSTTLRALEALVSCELMALLGGEMAEFHVTVTIDQTREKVFAYLVDPATQTVWQSGLQEFEADWADVPRVGDRARG